jgi:hypothetical protein
VEPLPPSVRRVEDVTPELLGGATAQELAAFRMAALQQVLRLECAERTAILLLYADGDGWRERVADLVPVQWGLIEGTVARQPGTECDRKRRRRRGASRPSAPV